MNQPQPRSPGCSTLSATVGEPLTASAPHYPAWLAIEQPGPWGRKAPTSSHLDRVLGAELDARAKAAGVMLVLIRRPGRHADEHRTVPRSVLISHPAAGWLETALVDQPRALLDLDFAELAEGKRPSLGALTDEPVVLVCTNGRRDLCCAEAGRALVHELSPSMTGPVWESSHLGGHRFAPTVLILPAGIVLGRAGASDVHDALGGRLSRGTYRGRTSLTAPAQAAECHVRLGLAGADPGLTLATHDALQVGEPVGDGPWQVNVDLPDRTGWLVTVESQYGPDRPEACGREAVAFSSLVVTSATRTQG